MDRSRNSVYHEGHRQLQDRFDGRRLADSLDKHRRLDRFGEAETRFIQRAEFFFLATAHGESVDCSYKGGPAGFVRVRGPNTLEWDDYDGNSMYRSLGNIVKSPRVGMLFIQFGENPKRLRVNGLCELLDGQTSNGVRLTVRLVADEIFPNCPRYIPSLTRSAPSPYLPDASGVGIKPRWKDAEDLRDSLPEDDPHRD